MPEKVVFVLGDKLPTYYDAIISIHMVATKPKSKKMISTINSYTKALIDIWKRSFGDLHVTSRSSVTNKLQKLVEHYYSQVYVKVYRELVSPCEVFLCFDNCYQKVSTGKPFCLLCSVLTLI